MDWQTGFGIVCSLATAAMSLWVKALRDDLAQMKHDHKNLQTIVSNLREAIPQRYATIEDLRDSITSNEKATERVLDTLVRIENKLDGKMDKQ